jgi:hypothetical protein
MPIPSLSRRMIGLALAGVLAGCAAPAPDLRSDYDREVDFSQYRTYAFFDRALLGATRADYSTMLEQRIEEAIALEMEARGYTRSETPDLRINYRVVTEEVQEVRSAPSARPVYPHYGYRGRYYDPWPSYGYDTWVVNYEKGSLIIDLVDAETNRLVWEGAGEGRVSDEARKDIEAAVKRAVGLVMGMYPFRAGSNAATGPG